MLDPELKEKLDLINKNLEMMNINIFPTRWKLFVQGLWRAVGYLVGLLLAVALLGWMLNIIGIVPIFQEVADKLKIILNNI